MHKNKKYLAAVSGGPDSMAMLNMFKKNIIAVLHVNYHKRVDSDNDMNIVKNYCENNNIKFEYLSVSHEKYEDIKNNNFQAKARTIRYEFFLHMANKYKEFEIIIAHNSDDFLETAIMSANRESANLFHGIKKYNNYKELKIYRPLIHKSKKSLIKYCIRNKIAYAIDSSNELEIYERNRVRKELKEKSFFHKKMLMLKFKTLNFLKTFEQFKVNELYDKWEKQLFDCKEFENINDKYKIYIVYKYLRLLQLETVNRNKIDLLIDFIKNGRQESQLRLQENVFVIKKKNLLEVKEV